MIGRRLALEALAITLGTIALWALVYGDWIESCCGILDGPLLFVLLVSAFVGGVVTGGMAADRGAVLIGFIVEALAAWAIVRLAMRARSRNAPSASGRDSG